MLQLELYIADINQTAKLFTTVFDLHVVQEKVGYIHLSHSENFDILLFDPSESAEGEAHWPLPENGMGGCGIEIVINVTGIQSKHKAVSKLGYECSELRPTPWGSTEFTFHLKEGYLLRIKEPKVG